MKIGKAKIIPGGMVLSKENKCDNNLSTNTHIIHNAEQKHSAPK